jgi:hypothetical protein
MKSKICKAFASCEINNCLETMVERKFQIKDNELTGKSEVVKQNGTLNITNERLKNIEFLAIDNCIYGEKDKKRCDCALFNDNYFYFVEFKTFNTKNNSKHRKSAIEQFESTITQFKKAGIEFSEFDFKTLICFNYIPIRPAASTQMQHKRKEFWDKYKADLLERNEIKF